MTMCEPYNGYPNVFTWNVNLWLANDEGYYRWMIDLMKQIAAGTLSEYRAAEHVEEVIGEQCLPSVAGIAADIMSKALGKVDWYHIINSWLEDYRADNPPETEEETES